MDYWFKCPNCKKEISITGTMEEIPEFESCMFCFHKVKVIGKEIELKVKDTNLIDEKKKKRVEDCLRNT